MATKLMKKICFVATVEFAVTAFLLNHLRALSKVHDVTVVVNTNNPHFLHEQGINAKVVPLAIARDINLISDISCLLQLVKLFYQQRFSAVHSITPKAGILAMLAAYIVRVPLRVHTFTGQIWVTKTGFKRYFLKQIDCLIASLSTHNLVDSPSQCEFLLHENVISSTKSTVLAKGSISGVDISRFKPDPIAKSRIRQELNITEDAILFLFLGRLTVDKGLLDLAKAFGELNFVNAHLLFVGPDEQALQVEITRVAGESSMNTQFIGHTNTPEVFIAAADVLCLPSYREGFGSVVIEAASAGVPAIASRIYGITDAVVDNETGLLHAPHDIEAIKSCLQKMLDNPTLRLKLGQQAQARAIKDFNSHLITQAWVDFYRKNLP